MILDVLQKKQQKKKIKYTASCNFYLSFGNYGLKIAENYFITSKQLEMLRIILSKYLKKTGKVWFKVFPNRAVTTKPLEIRMGKGKGHITSRISQLRSGTVLFELAGLPHKTSLNLLRVLAVKLPFKTLILIKNA